MSDVDAIQAVKNGPTPSSHGRTNSASTWFAPLTHVVVAVTSIGARVYPRAVGCQGYELFHDQGTEHSRTDRGLA